MDSALEEPLIDTADENEITNITTNDDPNDEVPAEIVVDDTIRNPWKNKNVLLSLAVCVTSGIADSIWSSVVLSGFLFALGKAMGKEDEDNTLVGVAEMVQGLTMLLFALPIGYLADKTGKSRVVRWGGGLMLLTVAITVWALAVVEQEAEESTQAANHAYYIMLVALGLWGICGGILDGPSQALFSDSIPKGKRSELLTYLYSSYLISSAIGPLLGIVMLSSSDKEDWSLGEIFPVFLVGIVLEIPVAVLCFFFSDDYTVPEPEDQAPPSTENDSTANEASDVDATQDITLTEGYLLPKGAVPYVLFISSLVVALGSGASVKYFPLFFKEIGLRSEVVQGIFLAVPVSISAFSFVSQRISKKLGRIETSVMFNTCGVSLLYLMTWLSRDVADDQITKKIVIVVIYLLRTGIMNCAYPLLESILMDVVPSNQRARWKSLESIAAFGWTGSALLGGILSDAHSYQYTFAMTATMQLFGGLMLIPIQPLVEDEQHNSTQTNNADGDRNAEIDSANELEQPLISEE